MIRVEDHAAHCRMAGEIIILKPCEPYIDRDPEWLVRIKPRGRKSNENRDSASYPLAFLCGPGQTKRRLLYQSISITGDQDLRYTQKPVCIAIFTNNSRSYLLLYPVKLRGTVVNRTYGIHKNLYI